MVILRILTTDDWPLWRDLRIAALTDAPHAFKARLADWHHGGEERWRARLHLPGAHHVAALLDGPDGTPVGLADGVPGADGVRELRAVWVGPQARGRGVADRLIEEVERWARASGGTTLRLAVIPGNEPALALYRRHGFTALAEPGEPLADGVTRELVMAKPLR
ncbi:ribosomal protein S18 acetylase RimI-like enzyme [Kitasatospora sp. MAA19]|uniref:GNAT family N-acetyltransferase n=1 Tax=unclassified Kitasatospora TaxID=2633591 RepID=UPI00247352A1|nr:GNAT family N-acetyltransferase [Kitasatospora sp. MAA19]MDH6706772.1 ribosomal protein S18 acetylase RimI-like enzyme [Kitasatospora sp. MAA19]